MSYGRKSSVVGVVGVRAAVDKQSSVVKKRLSKSSLNWFIRTRSYVTVPDLRRRFNIDGGDEVVAMEGPGGRAYIGLPQDAGQLVQDLWREGKIGLDLALDVHARSVTGLYTVPNRADRITGPPRAPARGFDDDQNDAPWSSG